MAFGKGKIDSSTKNDYHPQRVFFNEKLVQSFMIENMQQIMAVNSYAQLKVRLVQIATVLTILWFLVLYDTTVLPIIIQAVSDAYLQVSAFVFAALYLIYLLEKFLNINALELLGRKKWEVPFASFLGALPGCGGALVVTTQYVKGRQSFGALTATLIATMGDAAFLLLAKEPLIGCVIFLLGFTIGWFSGTIINQIHGKDFMRPRKPSQAEIEARICVKDAKKILKNRPLILDKIWLLLMIPGIILAGFIAFQFDFPPEIMPIILAVGLFGGVLSWLMHMISGQDEATAAIEKSIQFSQEDSGRYHLSIQSFIDDTNFVTLWVMLAFLLFEVSVHLLGIDLKALFNTFLPLVPLVAILIGFLPGCGPQILVATLYLEGFIPLSALLGNAISNDGDALFPALALARKAAIVATIYSAAPALMVAYGYYFLFEI